MQNRYLLTAGAAILIATAGVLVVSNKIDANRAEAARIAKAPKPKPIVPDAVKRSGYSDFIAKNESSKDAKVQDKVARTRMKLAYLQSHNKDYNAARATLLAAAKTYKGEGKMSPEFGGAKDQALYQAAATLNAEGRKVEYRKALTQFLKDQALSPLIYGAYKRLVALDGHSSPDVEALMQAAQAKQQAKMEFETSVCGPKAAAYLLEQQHLGKFDYKTLAKECGTTKTGTSMDALRACLEKHGLKTFGFRLNRKDFSKLAAPAVLFAADHYVVITAIHDDHLEAYDPRFGTVLTQKLPPMDDDKFFATVLTPSMPTLSN